MILPVHIFGLERNQVDLRRTDLTDTIVRAPFSGIAISKDAQPGEMISPVSAGGGFTRTGICTIVDMASLELLKAGAECEVLDPPELRNRIAAEAKQVARLYGTP